MPGDARPARLTTTPDRVAFDWEVTCPPGDTLQIRSDVLLEVAPSHLHFARLRYADGAGLERVLSEAEPTWTDQRERAAGAARRFLPRLSSGSASSTSSPATITSSSCSV